MKLVRYGLPHQEKPGILDSDGQIRDLSGTVPDITGEYLSPATLASLRNIDLAKLPLVPGKPPDAWNGCTATNAVIVRNTVRIKMRNLAGFPR